MEPEHHTFGREEHFHTFSRYLSKHESLNTSEICQFHRGPKNQASCKLPQPYLTGDSLGPVILKPTFLKNTTQSFIVEIARSCERLLATKPFLSSLNASRTIFASIGVPYNDEKVFGHEQGRGDTDYPRASSFTKGEGSRFRDSPLWQTKYARDISTYPSKCSLWLSPNQPSLKHQNCSNNYGWMKKHQETTRQFWASMGSKSHNMAPLIARLTPFIL